MGTTEELRAVIERRVAAVSAKDVAALAETFAQDVVLFDALGELRDQGVEAEVARLEQWFGAYDGPIELTLSEVDVAAEGSLGFGHFLFRVRGTMTDGTRVSMWVRSTVCLRDAGEGWRIVHEHSSVPFDGATGRARADLLPR